MINPENGAQENAKVLISSLAKLEQQLRSGKIENRFRGASEKERYDILELLEKLMELGELADEAASRLIFRGMTPFLEKNGK